MGDDNVFQLHAVIQHESDRSPKQKSNLKNQIHRYVYTISSKIDNSLQ